MTTPVWVRSHNRSPVDVYLFCGAQGPSWLGVVAAKGAEALEIPPGRASCAGGLSFFLVHQRSGRGYWVGPVRARTGSPVELVIEKYAGLSSAHTARSVRY